MCEVTAEDVRRAREFVEEKLKRMVKFPDDIPGWLAAYSAAETERLQRNIDDFDNSYLQDEGIAPDGEIRKLTSKLRERVLAAEAERDRLQLENNCLREFGRLGEEKRDRLRKALVAARKLFTEETFTSSDGLYKACKDMAEQIEAALQDSASSREGE